MTGIIVAQRQIFKPNDFGETCADLDNVDMNEKPSSDSASFSWLASWRIYMQPASLRMLFWVLLAGLPLLLVLGTLSFRLREAGIDRSTIGDPSWVASAYGFKWVWAPLVHRTPIPL
jgi:PAT family beta-lactamase induction signal transducer AmpG